MKERERDKVDEEKTFFVQTSISFEMKRTNLRHNLSYFQIELNIWSSMGSGCVSVGRAVASNIRDPRFKSSHYQTFIEHLLTINWVENEKRMKKDARNG